MHFFNKKAKRMKRSIDKRHTYFFKKKEIVFLFLSEYCRYNGKKQKAKAGGKNEKI